MNRMSDEAMNRFLGCLNRALLTAGAAASISGNAPHPVRIHSDGSLIVDFVDPELVEGQTVVRPETTYRMKLVPLVEKIS